MYYKPNGYDNKPYIGILVNKNDRKYVIPLSSAKDKHKTWKNVNKECYLLYEKAEKSKDLLNKEYRFCLKIITDVLEKANKLYDKQIRTGKVAKFCCDFKALEEVADRT